MVTLSIVVSFGLKESVYFVSISEREEGEESQWVQKLDKIYC